MSGIFLSAFKLSSRNFSWLIPMSRQSLIISLLHPLAKELSLNLFSRVFDSTSKSFFDGITKTVAIISPDKASAAIRVLSSFVIGTIASMHVIISLYSINGILWD